MSHPIRAAYPCPDNQMASMSTVRGRLVLFQRLGTLPLIFRPAIPVGDIYVPWWCRARDREVWHRLERQEDVQ